LNDGKDLLEEILERKWSVNDKITSIVKGIPGFLVKSWKNELKLKF